MIKVLHVVNIMDRGGAETFIMNVYRNIDRNKIQFDFLVHQQKKGSYDDEIISLGGKIFYVTPRNQGIRGNKKSLDDFFSKHNNYDVVHAHLSSLSYIEPLKYAKKYGIGTRVIHAHSTKEGGLFLHKYIHKINQLFIKKIATNYFSCSDLASNWMFGKNIYKNKKYKIINNGIETQNFKYNRVIRDSVRNRFDINKKVVIGNIGRFTYAKNHKFILEIFNELKKLNNDVVLMLVGDGELRNEIEDKVKEIGLQDSVIFTGVRSDISELLQAMDIFLFPSHYEGLPVTLIEAQATGIKCIVSENITKQVAITDNITYLSLEKCKKEWARLIMNLAIYNRKDETLNIEKAGFDIMDIVDFLSKFYMEKRVSNNDL